MTIIRSTRRTWIALLAFVLLSVVVVETPASATPGSSVRDWNLNASNALFNLPAGSPPAPGWRCRGSCISRWCRARSTTPSTRSTAATSRISQACPTPRRPIRSMPRSPPPPTTCSSGSRTRSPTRCCCPRSRATGSTRRSCLARGDPRRRLQDRRDRDRRRSRGGDARRARRTTAASCRSRSRVGTDPGEWRPTPPGFVNDPFAWVANVDPFMLESTSQFRTDGPNALTSAEYTAEYNEVKELGRVDRTAGPPSRRPSPVLHRERDRDAEPHVPHDRRGRGAHARRGGPPVRDAEPGRRRRGHQLLGRQGVPQLLAADHGDPLGRQRHQPDNDGRPGVDAAVPDAPGTPPYPDHPSGYNCITGSIMHAAKDFFGTNKVAFTVTATRRVRTATTRASRTSTRTRSMRASTSGSTSGPRTCRERCSARRSPPG